MERARLVLAEDHKEMREMIESLIKCEFELVGTVANGQSLLEAESRLKPDVCVIDISMPILNGIEAANLLQERRTKAKIVFLTIHSGRDYLEAALEAGALGYVLKPRMGSDLIPAIKEALSDRLFISPSMPSASSSVRIENRL